MTSTARQSASKNAPTTSTATSVAASKTATITTNATATAPHTLDLSSFLNAQYSRLNPSKPSVDPAFRCAQNGVHFTQRTRRTDHQISLSCARSDPDGSLVLSGIYQEDGDSWQIKPKDLAKDVWHAIYPLDIPGQDNKTIRDWASLDLGKRTDAVTALRLASGKSFRTRLKRQKRPAWGGHGTDDSEVRSAIMNTEIPSFRVRGYDPKEQSEFEDRFERLCDKWTEPARGRPEDWAEENDGLWTAISSLCPPMGSVAILTSGLVCGYALSRLWPSSDSKDS